MFQAGDIGEQALEGRRLLPPGFTNCCSRGMENEGGSNYFRSTTRAGPRPGTILNPTRGTGTPMTLQLTRLHAPTLRAAAIAASLLASASVSSAQRGAAGPFEGLSGSWSGNGTVTMGNGARERIRCRVTYAVQSAGRNVQQDLRCASDSYKFELSSNIESRDGNLAGTWTETTRNIGGSVSGRASGNQIQGLVASAGFSATISVVTRGDRQSVNITSQGSEISEVDISLRKSGR
jgi:hypothetical protein